MVTPTQSAPSSAPVLPSQALAALPITRGHIPDLTRDPFRCMRALYRTHGTIAALEESDGQRVIFIFGPHYNQEVLSDTDTYHARFFSLRGSRNSAQRRLTAALLSMNGEEHKTQRRIVHAPFQKQAVESYRDRLAVLAEDMVAGWQAGQERDLFRDVTRFMQRVSAGILLGIDEPSLVEKIGDLTERWVAMNHELGLGAVVPHKKMASCYDSLLRMADELELEIRTLIDRRRDLPPGLDVTSLLLQARERPDSGVTDTELIGQTAILFAAGYLTTANTLAWTSYLLAQHPDVAAALAAELRRELGGKAPTLADFPRLPLLDRVVKESMRILPASFYSQRINTVPVELGPFHLIRGTPIVFSQYITHHMPDLFPDPERFLPERWQTISPSPYAYLPFGAGARLCLGAPMALITLKITLAVILQRFTYRLLPGSEINGRVTSTMFAPAAGIPVRLAAPETPWKRMPVSGSIHEMVNLD